jgi:hypothetical protein
MYTETLIPWGEIIAVALFIAPALVYKYITHRKYVKQYPYGVQRYLRSTDRIVRTWSEPEPAPKRSKTVHVGTMDGKPVYLKEDALYGRIEEKLAANAVLQ